MNADLSTVLLYCIEPQHLARLRALARRLYTEERMNGDDMRNAAHALTAIADYAEKMPYPQASES